MDAKVKLNGKINANRYLNAKLIHIILFLLLPVAGMMAQTPVSDTLPLPLSSQPDSAKLVLTDSLPAPADSLVADVRQFSLSKDSLDAPVEYDARDSMIYDIAGQKVHLFGNASVKYQTITLEAAHIIFDWSTNIVTAGGLPDSTGNMAGFPKFTEAENEFNAKRMEYNFRTRKGFIYEVTSQQDDIVVHAARSKFVGTADTKDTTQQRRDIIYSEDAIFTTCTHPEPHFGIRSSRQKVIPNKLVVVGPSNLEIMNVPTPLWLPFGFFPINKGRRTGLLFPRDYEFSPALGFGIKDIGWFFPLGDNFNLSITSNIYLKGTWGVNARSQYRKRYKYSGSFDLGFDSRRTENLSDGSYSNIKAVRINVSHNQDRSAHPSITFGGNINFETSGFGRRVYNDAYNVLNNTLNSNFSFSKNWQDKPMSLNISLSHDQNRQTGLVNVSFPVVQFQTQTLYPFRSEKRIGPKRWYEDITLRYTSEARNRVSGVDTAFFTNETLKNAQYGMQQNVTTGTSFKILKYFNLNPSASYREVWYFRSLRKNFLPGLDIDTIFPQQGPAFFDTLSFGQVMDTFVTGFEAFRTFSAGVTLNTQIFGTLKFGKGWLRGIRHVMKPSISFNFSPNYLNPSLGYFRQVADPADPTEFDQYSIFQQGIFGGPPSSGRQMGISYSINNIFEAKYYSKKDSSEQKLKLFDNIVLGGNYNFAADSLKWSQVNIGGTTRFFKGVTTVSVRAVLDPYISVVDSRGALRRVNRLAWNEKGRPLEFVSAGASFTSGLTVGKIRSLFQGKEEEVVEDLRSEPQPGRIEETDFLSLFENFSINHNLQLDWRRMPSGRDSFTVSFHSVNLQGSIQLTRNWNINIGGIGYDFKSKTTTYPYLGFSRDLHCWEMGMTWAPDRGTYSFYIQVKPGTLDFIKLPYQRNNFDANRAFQ